MRQDEFTPSVPKQLQPTKGGGTLRVSVYDGDRRTATTKLNGAEPFRAKLPASPTARAVVSRYDSAGTLLARGTVRRAKGARVDADVLAPPKRKPKGMMRGVINGPSLPRPPAHEVAMASRPVEPKRPRLFGQRLSTRRLLT